ncbi:DNA primase [Streptomyces sp. NPDC057280]|uniref:DNA primase n=1 Tax=Streptomyces sp. NPDC057280 TaxID=3346081 RepID=UPI0036367271
MNRVGLGLAVGAGYVLGRTKKMKLAFAVGTLVAGKRMQLSPRALADLVSGQLRDNPQFKEIGDQLREDLRGVGKAASGAMVERQLDALADRLHGRTAQVRDQLAGALPDGSAAGSGKDEADDEENDRETDEYDEDEAYEESGDEPEAERDEPEPPRKKAAAKKAPAKKTAAKKAPAKKSAAKAPAKKATAGAKKTAAKKTASARGARSRVSKGGGDR